MKISNSKKELAKIISENGGWRKGSHAAQDSVIRFFTGDKPKYNKATKLWDADNSGLRIIAIGGAKLLQNRQRTILSSAEYFHLYPAQDADGWIEFDGTEQPSGYFNKMIDVKLKSGLELTDSSGRFEWDAEGQSRIIAYRLHKPEQQKPEYCESVTRSIPEPEVKPTIEQLAADYRNRKYYADRKQDEADKANMESDAALSELEKAIAAIGFAITPICAVAQEPELAITSRGRLELDDVIWLSECRPKNDMPEGEYRVVRVGTIGVDFDGAITYPDFSRRSWRFIRRPAK